MAWQYFEVEHYSVHVMALNTPGFEGVRAYIKLSWAGKSRATLWFHASPTSNPNLSMGSGDITYYGRFMAEQLPASVDLLRNEKPVYFGWNDTSQGVDLSTTAEPVGEGELAP